MLLGKRRSVARVLRMDGRLRQLVVEVGALWCPGAVVHLVALVQCSIIYLGQDRGMGLMR